MEAGRTSGGVAAGSGAPEIGQRVESHARTVTESDIRLFADLTGDTHPQHLDAEWAKSSIFGERVAHGLLVLALSFGLVDLDPERVVALRRVRDAVFKRPARIGEEIRTRATVVEVRPVGDDVALVDFEWDVIDRTERKLMRSRVEVLWRLDRGGTVAAGPTLANPDDLFGGELYL